MSFFCLFVCCKSDVLLHFQVQKLELPHSSELCSNPGLGVFVCSHLKESRWRGRSALTRCVCLQGIVGVNARNNGEVFLLRRFAQKHLGPSLRCFLATISQPLQVSWCGHRVPSDPLHSLLYPHCIAWIVGVMSHPFVY